MIYKEFQGLKLSALALGTMRLPVLDGEESKIDKEQTARMIAYALEQGVNYFDTAWGYHGGNSETVVGEILSQHPRDSFYLASKFPGYDLANMGKVAEIFPEQLKKCRVEHFDFYLIHNVCELNIDDYLDETHGLLPYLLQQKAEGRIRHLGFSIHCGNEVLERFLEVYGPHMEFCQVQLNYVDWSFQDAKTKLEILKRWNIPVFVMEPMRGGQLARLPEDLAARLQALRPEESIPGWAFRYLQTLPEVVTVLGGMSDFQQTVENIRTFETDEPLNEAEMAVLMEVADSLVQAKILPCTACRYCTAYCPQKLDIPYLLSLYNEHVFTGGGFFAPMALDALPEEKRPAACTACHRCEAVCPQQIRISESLTDFVQKLKG